MTVLEGRYVLTPRGNRRHAVITAPPKCDDKWAKLDGLSTLCHLPIAGTRKAPTFSTWPVCKACAKRLDHELVRPRKAAGGRVTYKPVAIAWDIPHMTQDQANAILEAMK